MIHRRKASSIKCRCLETISESQQFAQYWNVSRCICFAPVLMASNLVFINTSGPDDSKSDAKRKAVRSQAAKDHSTSSSNKPEGAGRRRHRKLLSVEIDLDVYGSDASGGSGSPPTLAESSAVAPEVPSNLDRTEPPSTGNDLDPVERTLTKLGLTSPFVPYPENQIAPAMLSHCKSSRIQCTVAYRHPKGLS